MAAYSSRSSATGEAPGSLAARVAEAVPAPLPTRVGLALAKQAERPPRSDRWLHEVKFDGYRLAARIENGGARLFTRNGLDWTDRFPTVAEALGGLAVATAIIDGELIAVGDDGRPDFAALQKSAQPRSPQPGPGNARLAYQAFDLMYIDGLDVTKVELEQRKALLADVLEGLETDAVRYTDHLEVAGDEVYDHACRIGLEGIVSKLRGSTYAPGRTGNWLKSACLQTDDLVVGGFTAPQGSRTGFGALLLGRPRDDGRLTYAGKVGTGFGPGGIAALAERLDPLITDSSPFAEKVPRDAIRMGVTWTEPRLMVEVAHSGVTDAGSLRHPRFKYVRDDKFPEGDTTMAKTTASKGRREVEVAGVNLTSADRVLYPEQGATKRDLAEYYEAVGEELLRRASRRPLALVRCPEGTAEQCFYQKHPGPSFASGLPRVPIQEKDDVEDYVYLESVANIVSLVQLGVLEIHAWGSKVDHLEQPDIVVFDLDPSPGVDLSYTKRIARRMREVLTGLGLGAFLRATGGKGLHVVVPLVPEADWDQVKAFAKAVAEAVAATDPERLTTNMSKAKRQGKIFIDYLRNGRGSTAIVNYSTRSRQGAPVAVPLRWEELGRLTDPASYDIVSARRRLSSLREDPWEGFEEAAAPLSVALAKVSSGEGLP